MPWIKASERYPFNDWQISRIIGSTARMPLMFAPNVIVGIDGKTYRKEDVEWFDPRGSFTIEDMEQAHKSGQIYGFEKSASGLSNETFLSFMKREYKIDLK